MTVHNQSTDCLIRNRGAPQPKYAFLQDTPFLDSPSHYKTTEMSATCTQGWMKKTAYIFNVYLNDHNQWDWKGVSTVDFWIPVRSRWTSYAEFEDFFHSAEPTFKKGSHYRISALPEPLVGCEPLLACCQVLPLTFVKAKRWYIYEQPPANNSNETIHHSTHIKSLETAVDQLTNLTNLLLKLQSPSGRTPQVSLPETEICDNTNETADHIEISEFSELQVCRSPPHVTTPQHIEDDIVTEDTTEHTHVNATTTMSPEPLTLSNIYQSSEDILSERPCTVSPLSPVSFDSESSEWLYLSGED